MIGAGLRRRAGLGYPDTDVGMLDVSANALAVLILATMLVLTVAAPPALRGEVRAAARPDLFYPSPLDAVVTPQSAYWIVTGAGLTRLDLDAFATGLSDGSTVATTPQGEATLIVDRRNTYRDLNDHRLQVSLDWDAVAGTAAPIAGAADVAEAVTAIGAAFTGDGTVPTFVVADDGMAAFAALYWALRQEQVPMRWVSIATRTHLVLSRRVDNFETRVRQWQ